MFNLEFLAANTGAVIEKDKGSIFAYETVKADETGKITLKAAPVPVVTNGTAYVWYRKSSENIDMKRKAAPSTEIGDFEPNTEYCVMYRKAVDGEMITINSQFIPDTLHAVLTVALYSGDNCNVEAATKAGEITIDIPRLQLTGASEISMTATGAAQTALEGNALASGCSSCDGKAIYATITKFISGANWYDDADGLVIEDLSGLKVGDSKDLVVYAFYGNKAPKKVNNSELTIASDGTVITTANGKVNAISAGNGYITVSCTAKPAVEGSKYIVVSE